MWHKLSTHSQLLGTELRRHSTMGYLLPPHVQNRPETPVILFILCSSGSLSCTSRIMIQNNGAYHKLTID